MSGTVEINDTGVIVNLAAGGRVVIGNWGDGESSPSESLQPLTPEEEKYGRGLCLLPGGWEDLTGNERWLAHLSDALRQQWPALHREQKMSIAYTIGELADELHDRAFSVAGY